MGHLFRIGLLLSVLCLGTGKPAWSAQFNDEVERNFPLRSLGNLQISNLRGSITVTGWTLDRIRVRAQRSVSAESAQEAQKKLQALDFRYRVLKNDIELAAEYGRGLEIQERLKERREPTSVMNIEVMAPAGLKLMIWAAEGGVKLQGWNAPVEIRTSQGPIEVSDSKTPQMSLLCTSCPISVTGVRGTLRCMGGSGKLTLSEIQADHLYAETTAGDHVLQGITGRQLYVSQSGKISGYKLDGHVEFHSVSGGVELDQSGGYFSGKTETGPVRIKLSRWEARDKAFIESSKGSISLVLPMRFVGELDASSEEGQVTVAFPVRPTREKVARVFGISKKVQGQVGEGGDQLRVRSRFGNVVISRENLP